MDKTIPTRNLALDLVRVTEASRPGCWTLDGAWQQA